MLCSTRRSSATKSSVFAMVHLSSQAEADLNAFEDFVRKQPLVRECWMLSGEIDFVLKCVAPDLKTFQAFVENLTSGPNVRNVKTSLTLRQSKGRSHGADESLIAHCSRAMNERYASFKFLNRVAQLDRKPLVSSMRKVRVP